MSYTIAEAMTDAANKLSAAGVDAPRLAAQVLMAHVLGMPRSRLLADSQSLLQPHQLDDYCALIARCAAGEPLAYVVGHTEFYTLDLLIDHRALIPRPETELLVEIALNKCQDSSIRPMKVVDVGTGAGCIVIALAVNLPSVHFMAIDNSAEALELARVNAQRQCVDSHIQFLCGDLLAPVAGSVDGIVANLPYVTTNEWYNLPRNIRDYEPRAALDGGIDGLDLIRRLIAQAPRCINPDGWLLLEIGAAQGTAVSALAQQTFPQAEVKIHRDYAGLERVVEIQLRSEVQ